MSSEDPLASVSKGVTEATLGWTESKIKGIVQRFINKDIAFIEDFETIEVLKKQRKTSEWNLFKENVQDKDLKILFQMGLTLRKLEKDRKRVESLREKILNKYGSEGIHFAQFIQNGFFSKYLGNIMERAATPQQLTLEMENLFKNIDNMVIFIQQRDDIVKRTEQIVTKINANSPKTFIICSSKSAMGKCEKIKINVMKRISDYDVELYKTEIKEIYFLNKSDS